MDRFIEKWVPILDEHTIEDDDGNAVVALDAHKLQLIAQKNNARIQSTGDMAPIVIGHTRDGETESRQPEIVGWMRRYRVAPLYNTGKKAIEALCRFYKNKRYKINKYPRRSVELWLSDWKIDPLSLLGASTPDRDLGLLQLGKDGAKKIVRVLPKRKTMDHEAIVEAVMAALKETDVFKWVESKMQEENSGGDEMGEGGEVPDMEESDLEGADDDLLGAEEDIQDAEGMGNDQDMGLGENDGEGIMDDAEDDAQAGEEPLRMAAGAPGGSNTFTPGGIGHDNKSKQQHPKYSKMHGTAGGSDHIDGATGMNKMSVAKKNYAKDKNENLVVRYRNALDQVSKEVKGLRLKFQRAEREKDLIKLQAIDNVDLDVAEELEAVAELPDAAYARHLGIIKKRYQKAPIGGMPNYTHEGRLAGNGAGTKSKEKALEIAEYARKKGLSYSDALEQFDGK